MAGLLRSLGKGCVLAGQVRDFGKYLQLQWCPFLSAEKTLDWSSGLISSTKLGSTALIGCPRLAPWSEGFECAQVAACFRGLEEFMNVSSVHESAFYGSGLQSRWPALSNAANPSDLRARGLGRMLNLTRRWSASKLDGISSPLARCKDVHAWCHNIQLEYFCRDDVWPFGGECCHR